MTIINNTTLDWKNSPRLIWIPDSVDDVSAQDFLDTCRKVHEANLMNLDEVNHLVDAAGKQNLGGGEKVGITVTNRDLQIAFTPSTTPKTVGNATSTDSGTTLVDTGADFISDGVEAGALLINLTDGSLAAVISVLDANTITHTQLGGGTGNDWDISDSYKIWNTIQKTVLGGNVVAVDALGADISPIFPTPLTQVVVARSTSSSLTDLDAIRYASYQNSVWLQPSSSNVGTAYPSGNRQYPVNNLLDAVAIAIAQGFDTIKVMESTTLDNGTDIRDFHIEGVSRSIEITIDTNAICDNITISNCTVTGILDGGTHITNCNVGTLSYVNGHIDNCGLYEVITLDGNDDAVISNCYSIKQDSPPTIDMGGFGQSCAVPNYSGVITVKNLTSPAESIQIGLLSGYVVLDPTVTAGVIIIAGVGNLVDSATSYTYINLDALLNRETITKMNWDMVSLDTNSSYSGTSFPNGTHSRPVNNISDAIDIATENNIHRIHCVGSVTLTQSLQGFTLESDSESEFEIDLNGMDCDKSNLKYMTIIGSATGKIYCSNCTFSNGFSGAELSLIECEMHGYFTSVSGGQINGNGCTAPELIYIDLNDDGSLGLANFSGVVAVLNATDAAVTIGMTGYFIVTLDSSCTNGSALIGGTGILTNNSSMTVINRVLPQSTWDEPLSAHTAAGTLGLAIAKILGLNQENFYIDNFVYDANQKADSFRVRIYSVKGSVGTDSDVIETYNVTISKTDGLTSAYKQVVL